jgi:hypothetical protein
MEPVEWCSMMASAIKPTNPLLRSMMTGMGSKLRQCPFKFNMSVTDLEITSPMVMWLPAGIYRVNYLNFNDDDRLMLFVSGLVMTE